MLRADGSCQPLDKASQLESVNTRRRSSAVMIRLTEEEAAMLKDIAEWTGVSQSDVLRTHIRREHERLTKKRQPNRKDR